MVVNYSLLSDDGKYQNITLDTGVQNETFVMPTLDDFKMKLLKSESYVILYGFHSSPINLATVQGSAIGDMTPYLEKFRRHAPREDDDFPKYYLNCQLGFEKEELLNPLGENGPSCEISSRIYDGGNGRKKAGYTNSQGYRYYDGTFKVNLNDIRFKKRDTRLIVPHPVGERTNGGGTTGFVERWIDNSTSVDVGNTRIPISRLNRSDAYKKYADKKITVTRSTYNMNDIRFSSNKSNNTSRIKSEISEGLSGKGYPSFTGPVFWKVIHGTGPTFGAGTVSNIKMLQKGNNIITGGCYAMIKKSDYDALIKTRKDLGLSIDRFKKSGLFTEFEVEYDLPHLWECKFKLTKNNGGRIHDGRFDVTDKDIQSIPNSYDNISSTSSYKFPKNSEIVSLGGGKYGTAETARSVDKLTKIVTGDADFIQVPDRGKPVYWQHWYKFNGNGAFAGVDPDNVERFSKEYNDNGTPPRYLAQDERTDGFFSPKFYYGKYVSKMPKLYYEATKSPNESIYFKNPSFPRPVEVNGVQFVFNPKQVQDPSTLPPFPSENNELDPYSIDAINHIDPNFATSSFFGTPKKKGVVKFSTYDAGVFTLEIVEANRIASHVKNKKFKAYKLILDDESTGIQRKEQRGLGSDFDSELDKWASKKYSQKITFTDKTGKPDKLVLNEANVQNIPGVINEFTSQWSQDYSSAQYDGPDVIGEMAVEDFGTTVGDINTEWYDRFGSSEGYVTVPWHNGDFSGKLAYGPGSPGLYWPNEKTTRKEIERIWYDVTPRSLEQEINGRYNTLRNISDIRVTNLNEFFLYEVRYRAVSFSGEKIKLSNSDGYATKTTSYFGKYFTPVAGDSSSGGNVSNDPTLPAGEQLPKRLDPIIYDAVPHVEFNEDGTKLLIAQKAIGNFNYSQRERDRDYRKGYLKIIDRVDPATKVRVSFDIDPTGEKSTYEATFFNDLQITEKDNSYMQKGFQDGKFGLSKDGEFIACYFTDGDKNNLSSHPPRLYLYKNIYAERDAREYRSANEGGYFSLPPVQNNIPIDVPLNPNSNRYTYDAQENLDFIVQGRPFDGLSVANPRDELTCIPFWRPEFEYPHSHNSYHARTDQPGYINEVRVDYPLAKAAIRSQRLGGYGPFAEFSFDPYSTSTNNIHNDSEYNKRLALDRSIFYDNGENEPLTTKITLTGSLGCISVEMYVDESNPDSLTGIGEKALVLDTKTTGGGSSINWERGGTRESIPYTTTVTRSIDYNYRPSFSFVGSLRPLANSNDFASQYTEYDSSRSYLVGIFTGYNKYSRPVYDYSNSIETSIVRTKSDTGLSIGIGTHKFINIPYRYPITFLVDDIKGVTIETLKNETFNESEDKESTQLVTGRYGQATNYAEQSEVRYTYVSEKTGRIEKKDYYSGSLILKITPEYFDNADNPPIKMVTMRKNITYNGKVYDVTPKSVNIYPIESCDASTFLATVLPDGTTLYGTTTTTTTSTTTTLPPGEPKFHFDRFHLNRKDVRFVENNVDPFDLTYAQYTVIAQRYVSPSRPPTYEELRDNANRGVRYNKLELDSGPRFNQIKLNDSGNLLIFKNKFIDSRTSIGDLGALKTGIGLTGRGNLSFSYSQIQDAGGGNRQYALYNDKALRSFAGYDPAKPNDPLPTNAHVFFGRTNDDFDKNDINDFVINESGSTILYSPNQGPYEGSLLHGVADFDSTSTNNSDALYELSEGSKSSAKQRGNNIEKIKKFALSKNNNVLAVIHESNKFNTIASLSTRRGAPFGFGNAYQYYPESGIYPHQKPGSFSNIIVFDRTGDNNWSIRNGGVFSTTWELAIGKPESVAFEAFEDIRINKDGTIIAGLRYENNSSIPSINLSSRYKTSVNNENYNSSKSFGFNENLYVDGGSDFKYKNGFYIDVWKYNAGDKRWDMLGAKDVGGSINELRYFTSGDKHSIRLTNNERDISRSYHNVDYKLNHEGNVLAVTYSDKSINKYHFQEIYAYNESTDKWIKTFSRDSRNSLLQSVTTYNYLDGSYYTEDLTDGLGNRVYDPHKSFCHLHSRVAINNSGNIVAFSNPGNDDENSTYNREHFDSMETYNDNFQETSSLYDVGDAQHGCFEILYSPDANMHEANYYNLASDFGKPNYKALGLVEDILDAGQIEKIRRDEFDNDKSRGSTFGTDISLNASGNILAVSQEGLNSKDVVGVDFYDVKVAIDNFTLPATTTTTTTTTAMPQMPLKYHIAASGTLFDFNYTFDGWKSMIRNFSMDASGHNIAIFQPNTPAYGADPTLYQGRGVMLCRNTSQHSNFISDAVPNFANNPPPTLGNAVIADSRGEAYYGLGQVYDVRGEVDPYQTRNFNRFTSNYGSIIFDMQASVNSSGTQAVFIYQDVASKHLTIHRNTYLYKKYSQIQVIDLTTPRNNAIRGQRIYNHAGKRVAQIPAYSQGEFQHGEQPINHPSGLIYASGLEQRGMSSVAYYDPSLADNGTLIVARYTDKKLTYRIMNSGVSFGGNGTYNFDGELIGEIEFNTGGLDTMYNRHHSRYLPALSTIYGNNSIATAIYPPNSHKFYTDSYGRTRDQLRDFSGNLNYNDYTRYDHGPLAANYSYKSDIKTTSISSQGHVVAFLQCKDVGSATQSYIHPPTGIRTDNSTSAVEYRRSPDSSYIKALHEKDETRGLLFVTTIKGIPPGNSFITDINHEVYNTNTRQRQDKIVTQPQPFELSKDGNSIVVGSGLYRKNASNQYKNSFLMKNPWSDVPDLKVYDFTATHPPELIDNSINKDGTVIASLWGPKYLELYDIKSTFKGRYQTNSQGQTRYYAEPDMTSQYGHPRRNYIIQVCTSGEDASEWKQQIKLFSGNRCKNINLTASGDLVAYAMTEDNWHDNYFRDKDFQNRTGSLNTNDDPRKGYINFLENENIGHTPPT